MPNAEQVEASRALELADLIETRIIPQRLQGEPMIKVLATWETWQAILTALRAAPQPHIQSEGAGDA